MQTSTAEFRNGRNMNLSPFYLALLMVAFAVADINADDEWNHYGGNEKGTQYSSLKQINIGNVANLKIAWTFRTGEQGRYAFQSNPILVRNKLFVTTGTGVLISVDPLSGEEIWRYDPGFDRTRPTSEVANRGVASWIDPSASPLEPCAHRLFTGVLDSRLISVDAETGKPCMDFGVGGEVFLNKDVRLRQDRWINYQVTSPPVVVGDTLVIGSAIGDNRGVELELGIVRGFDARTGEIKWIWDPIPRNPDDPAHQTWDPIEVRKTGAANAWAPLAADSERNLVFVPTGSASPDHYGGERAGNNLYANSLVALRADTGELVWAQQLVHHDVWDYDLPAQPTLVDLRRDGAVIPAVIQATKTGMLFTFHRETGEPIFEIEERPVPQDGVDGEHLSPTQPFPVAPPPLVSHAPVTGDDAWGLLYFDERNCRQQIRALRSEGIYTPPGLTGSLVSPSIAGGMNWGGIAFDKTTQLVVANTSHLAMRVTLIPRDNFLQMAKSGDYPEAEFARQAGTPYGMMREFILSPFGVPCTKPPWGTLSAVDMARGTIKWQVTLGTIEDMAPAIVPNLKLGTPNLGGPIITAGGLIFIAAAMDNYLRAFDLEDGEELWKGRLPAGGQATPMTYFLEQSGKQYIVIAAGGHPKMGTALGDYLVAFSL